ncbi:MAG: hypothetical protein Q9N67_10395, partial [Ghiorsea sp.]|nr:hypothetical protein [Ghiorsea sp.]
MDTLSTSFIHILPTKQVNKVHGVAVYNVYNAYLSRVIARLKIKLKLRKLDKAGSVGQKCKACLSKLDGILLPII